MNYKLQRFEAAVNEYPEFKAQFSAFCHAMSMALKQNGRLPGVLFSMNADGTTADLKVFDQTFIVGFHMLQRADDKQMARRIGVLALYTNGAGGNVLLWRTFFERDGALKDTPEAARSLYNLRDKDFTGVFLDECSERHFARLRRAFETANERH